MLRADYGGEYTSEEFLSFCRQYDTKREITCADTPQQNEVAERKIWHLIETCKTGFMPKNYLKPYGLKVWSVQLMWSTGCHFLQTTWSLPMN